MQPERHSSSAASSANRFAGVVATVCADCGATVKWEDAISSEQEAMSKHRQALKRQPGSPLLPTSDDNGPSRFFFQVSSQRPT